MVESGTRARFFLLLGSWKTMNGPELLRVVEMIHRDKSIEKSIVFDGIEQAIVWEYALKAAQDLF